MRNRDEREYTFTLDGFTGISQSRGDGAPMHTSPDAENCETSGGTLRPASGWAADDSAGPAPGPIRTLMRHVRHGGGAAAETLVIATDTGLFRRTGAAWAEIPGGAALHPKRFSHAQCARQGKGLLVMANGVDDAVCWDGESSLVRLAADGPVVEGRPLADKEKSAIRLSNHGLAANAAVAFYPDRGQLPAGLAAHDTYFVKAAGAQTFTVGTSRTSSAVAALRSEGVKGWRVARVQWLGAASADPANQWIVLPGHGLMQNEAVVFDPWTGALPQGIEANRAYYAYLYDADRFYVTTAPDSLDDRVAFTTAGSFWRVRRDAQADWVTGAPSASAGTDLITLTGHGLTENTAIQFEAGAGAVPAPLTAHDGSGGGRYYYTVQVAPNTFKVAEQPGGEPVNLTASASRFTIRISRENRPGGSSLAAHAGRLWCAGDEARPGTVCCSAEHDPCRWAAGAGGEITHPGAENDTVTAAATLFDGVTVFRRRSMFRVAVAGPGMFEAVPVRSTVGTEAPASVCQWHTQAYFLAEEGLAAYDGIRAEPIGMPLRAFWERVNRSALPHACAVAHKGSVLLAVPVDGSPENNAVVEYDTARGTFLLHTGVCVAAWLPGEALRFASGDRVCVWGAGGPAAMRWASPETDLGQPGALKTVTGFTAVGRGGKLVVTVRADGREASKAVALPELTGAVSPCLRIKGKRLSVEISSAPGSAAELVSLTVRYEKEDDA